MDSQPLVSVLTPSFNQGRWLRTNLDSVAAQTYSKIEHVVMDGGSTDETLDVLHASENVRWRSERDRGQSHALNKALAESDGEIIGWLNADDAYFTTDVVATVVATFHAHPDTAVVYGHAALVDASNQLLHFLWVPAHSRRLLRRYNYVVQPSAFIRRSAIDEHFIDEAYDFWMDRELWLRLAESRQPFRRVSRILAADRHHPMRKSYRRDQAAAERQSLATRYGDAVVVHDALDRRVLRVASRLIGVTLLRDRGVTENSQFALDARARLVVRQVTMRRGQTNRAAT